MVMTVTGTAIGLALLGAVLVRVRFRLITVVGRSMTPALSPGDRVLIRIARKPVLGAIVVFRMPTAGPDLQWLVKRVAAVPGEPIPPDIAAEPAQMVVPVGRIAVRGDNPDSQDSRHFGLVPVDTVLGIVVRHFPATR